MTDTAAAAMRPSTPPIVHVLTTDPCLERLGTATVGRVGFVTPRGLQILPLNYRSTADGILLSTTANGSLSQLAEMGAALTLEVDEHDATTGLVWSVMVQGSLSKVPRGVAGARTATGGVDCWPGDQYGEALRFTAHTYSGRLLEHSAS
jgi:hypothetical protein